MSARRTARTTDAVARSARPWSNSPWSRPLFFFLLFAIIDFGRYVYYVQILNNAAREGARYAIVHGSDSLAPSGPPRQHDRATAETRSRPSSATTPSA